MQVFPPLITVRKSMHTFPADFHRLTLLIQRILDAESLCDTEGASLLGETEAARRCLEAGDVEAAWRHVEQVAVSMEALVQTEALALRDGRAVMETARRLLAGDTA